MRTLPQSCPQTEVAARGSISSFRASADALLHAFRERAFTQARPGRP